MSIVLLDRALIKTPLNGAKTESRIIWILGQKPLVF